jgi:hypothetical protein
VRSYISEYPTSFILAIMLIVSVAGNFLLCHVCACWVSRAWGGGGRPVKRAGIDDLPRLPPTTPPTSTPPSAPNAPSKQRPNKETEISIVLDVLPNGEPNDRLELPVAKIIATAPPNNAVSETAVKSFGLCSMFRRHEDSPERMMKAKKRRVGTGGGDKKRRRNSDNASKTTIENANLDETAMSASYV